MIVVKQYAECNLPGEVFGFSVDDRVSKLIVFLSSRWRRGQTEFHLLFLICGRECRQSMSDCPRSNKKLLRAVVMSRD
jgi:hypothetical protein